MQRRFFLQLAALVLIASQTFALSGLNLRRRPFGNEGTERSASALGDEIATEIVRAPLRSFGDPQQKVSTVTGRIPASQQVLVSCEFENKWTPATHPTDYPEDAHWSPIILASHSDQYKMWTYGTLATRGVAEVAEVRGLSATFYEEPTQFIAKLI